jgi:iron complex outermembrane receptor protein
LINDSTYLQVDFLSEFTFLRGDHRVLIGYSLFEDELDRLSRVTNPDAGSFDSFWDPFVDSPDYDIGYAVRGIPESYIPASYEDNTTEARYITVQSKYFEDRLVLLAGLRQEDYEQTILNSQRELSGGGNFEGTTPMYGFNYEFTPGFSFFASSSESYKPTFRKQVVAASRNLPIEQVLTPEEISAPGVNEEGSGYDIGFKTNWRDQLSGTFTLFEVEKSGQVAIDDARTVADPRNSDSNPDNDVIWYFTNQTERARGVEMDLVWRPNANWQLRGAYAWIWDAGVTESPVEEFVGKDFEDVPEHKVTFWGLYSFTDSKWEGLSVGFGGTYTGEFLTRNEWQFQRFTADAALVLDLLVRYETEFMGNDLTVSLNVKNLNNETYIAYAPNGDAFGREFRLTLDVQF